MSYVGIDIGTSGCKAVAFDEEGGVLAQAGREYDLRLTPDGGAELDPDEVMAACFEVLRECADGAAPGAVAALGISSQGEAFTAVDADGRCRSMAMVSSDARAAPCVAELVEQLGHDRLYQITGHTPHPLFTLFKLRWLERNHPEIWSEAAKFLCFEDLLQQRLGVEPSMGWSLAGRTMLFDVRRHRFDPEILEAVGLTPSHLAMPMPAGSPVGVVASPIARRLGLGEGAIVVTGGHDQILAALGAGVTRPGAAMYATGSVESIVPAFEEAVFTSSLRDSNLCTYDHALPETYATVAYSLTGGNILKWFRDEFGEAERQEAARTGRDAYELILETMWDRPSNLLVLPYFTPSGTPHFDTETKGAIVGLRMNTRRGEIVRALLEGVALEMRLNLDILERAGCAIDELRVVGGGARSSKWSQLKADVTGRPVLTLEVTEAGCLGAAMLACHAHTNASIAELASAWVKPVSELPPNAEHAAVYDEKFAAYRDLYSKARELRL